jgi:hypothetical protein
VLSAAVVFGHHKFQTQQRRFDQEILDRIANKASTEERTDNTEPSRASRFQKDGQGDIAAPTSLRWDDRPDNAAMPVQLSSGDVEPEQPTRPTNTTRGSEHRPGTGEASQRNGSPRSNVQKDLGVDLAVPTSLPISLRKDPSSSSAQILRVNDRDLLVLVDREPTQGWYDVIDVHSGKEGWVSQDEVRIQFTSHPKPDAKFSVEYTGTDSPPDVLVENETESVLSLKVGEDHRYIQPRSHLQIHVPLGTFRFYASVPDVLPASGTQTFERGSRYSWKFWVETRFVSASP